jgi:hypothetical protein
MSDVTFNGETYILTLRDQNGAVVGNWHANNRTTHAATLQFVPNGEHQVEDQNRPHTHGPEEDKFDGEYGSLGIIRFNVEGHEGVGIHSGRQGVRDLTPEHGTGPEYVTQGCIRTTDEAMSVISETMREDPLLVVHVEENRNQRQPDLA